jgi:cell division protein FtsQ
MMQISRTRLIVLSVALVATVGVSLYAFHELEQFLIRDARFTVAPTEASPQGVRITGVAHADRRAVEAVFVEDRGRSLYLVPMSQRLTELRGVDWVRDASVARIWPNRLVVNVTERTPVAFIALGGSRFGLIDSQGVVLPPSQDRYRLPVLTGVKASDEENVRRAGVERMLRLTSELGDSVADISEIDVSVPDNLAVMREYEGRMRRLQLGDERYAQRYQNFLKHFGEIEAKAPGATVIDLRLEDRITVVEAAE